ncbi:MAG TPA: ATP-binding protein [Vicinamibacterales bacterium]|jgi:signal transduction histidine kinase|nr:ATP-binding protein [Vicinamibacterales bacterium]
MTPTPGSYALLGLTALVACLVAVMTFALLRFVSAARAARRLSRSSGTEVALMSAALHEAVAKLKAQERATAARAEASERLSEEIVASLTAGLVVTGLDGEVRILNPAGHRMIGLPESATSEAIKRTLEDLSLFDVIRECLDTGTAIVRRTVFLPEPRHGVSHLGVSVSPLSDAQHAVHGAICLFTDLTAVKDLEEQLRLKDSLAAVGELTAGIAHEFRNGLATIHGYSKLFDLGELPEAYRAYLLGIRAETESLSQVVTNFLSFARPAELALSRVDLRGICERAADETRPDARLLGGDVAVRGEFGVIDGDEVLLRQAFSNLLRNALDACTAASVPPAIVIQSELDVAQRALRIAVNDNGAGIPQALRERVFQPFFTSKRNGTGLGLALVQKIIVFHNGRITASTSASGGASLQITLPVQLESHQEVR